MELNKKRVVIPEGVTSILNESFKDCAELEEVFIPDSVTEIGNSAFSGCKNLKCINFPANLNSIGDYAFEHCSSIATINIPASLKNIGIGAFSYMSSLENIEVDSRNSRYITYDNLSLIDLKTTSLIQYAIGSRNQEYSIPTVPSEKEIDKFFCRGNRRISKRAFAGSKYLNDLTFDTSILYIERTAFESCDNLKTLHLNLYSIATGAGFQITTDNDLKEWNDEERNYCCHNTTFPFEELYIEEGITTFETRAFASFKNLRKVHLPKESTHSFSHQIFTNSKNLKEIFIPKSVHYILFNSFGPQTTLKFENGLEIKTSELREFEMKTDGNKEKIYRLEDYCLVEKDNYIIKISEELLNSYFTNSEGLINKPIEVINYLMLLYYFNSNNVALRNGVFIHALSENLPKFDYSDTQENKKIRYFNNPKIASKHLMQDNINNVDDTLAVLFIKYFDANMKRMIELSGVTKDKYTGRFNMIDLLKLAKVLGAFEEEDIIRQRAITFINDNILTSKNNDSNIVGDDIHRVFNEFEPRDTFDSEFARFFMNNYQILYEEEMIYPGFFCRTYNSFEEIKEICTSDNGSQRQLLVTIEKVFQFAAKYKFTDVTKETEALATSLGYWFNEDEVFKAAVLVTRESLSAPRNIFTNNNNPDNDLKEPLSANYSFEWLPKQDYLNLLLGKFCNCCAHIKGLGACIMRASMVSPNHQNLVIKNAAGKIIGKSTIYVNKEQNYAVFNNVESSINYRSYEDLKMIYDAFMRGAKAFLTKYNENNPDNPILTITVGASRNTLNKIFDQYSDIHPNNDILMTPEYGNWAFNNSGSYSGDSAKKQVLVLKK